MDKISKIPKLTLVGAGPGDPELISIKGAKALAKADVILYDALAHPDLLDLAPSHIEKIYVGKRVGNCAYQQKDINSLIVASALKYGNVVRLKGGDPFVFGRGHEEIVYAKAHGLAIDIIPGITSAVAVPELAQIPLTTRGVNESFWVITGTTTSLEFSKDIQLAAQSSATVVILMGMTHLSQIAAVFMEEGKAETPAAVIQNGSLPQSNIILGTIKTIAQKVKQAGMESPAIIVFGEVVALHPDFELL
ncbi:MAG: uroporphyrinogen-III C-methyltransferase [Bacteroidota bacterium]|jgi:uroporphyrin-III C-methyltransferase